MGDSKSRTIAASRVLLFTTQLYKRDENNLFCVLHRILLEKLCTVYANLSHT